MAKAPPKKIDMSGGAAEAGEPAEADAAPIEMPKIPSRPVYSYVPTPYDSIERELNFAALFELDSKAKEKAAEGSLSWPEVVRRQRDKAEDSVRKGFKDDRLFILYTTLKSNLQDRLGFRDYEEKVFNVIHDLLTVHGKKISRIFDGEINSHPPNSDAALVSSAKPTTPPVLWTSSARLPKETAVDFIQRVYGHWIGNGLTRADLLRLDRPLYMALATWLQRKGNELPFDLPSRKERIDAAIAEVANQDHAVLTQRLKILERDASALRRRLKKAGEET